MMAKVTVFGSIGKRAQTVQLLAINLKKCKAKEKTFVKKKTTTFYFALWTEVLHEFYIIVKQAFGI